MTIAPPTLPTVFGRILTTNTLYSTSRIRVPDLEESLPAIVVAGQYYSFFQVIASPERTLRHLDKLMQRGDNVVLTLTPKGYALWIHEPDATPMRLPSPSSPVALPSQFRFIDGIEPYSFWSVRVPDLGQSLTALQIEGQYYSIFRMESQADKLLELLQKTTHQGDETLIAKTKNGYLVCILESGATPLLEVPKAVLPIVLKQAEEWTIAA